MEWKSLGLSVPGDGFAVPDCGAAIRGLGFAVPGCRFTVPDIDLVVFRIGFTVLLLAPQFQAA